MKGDPRWSDEEFEILLNNPKLQDRDLARKLPRRTVYAVYVLREEIHIYHTGREPARLSKSMFHSLHNQFRVLICHKCGREL